MTVPSVAQMDFGVAPPAGNKNTVTPRTDCVPGTLLSRPCQMHTRRFYHPHVVDRLPGREGLNELPWVTHRKW